MEFLSSPIILKTGESNALIKQQSFAPGTYYVQVQPNNNALLSSFLVSACPFGASAVVNYFQTTVSNEAYERTDLVSHNVATFALQEADQILVTRIHNKVFAELVVTGGTVTCGLYGTAVGYSATDFEAQFRYDGESVNLGADQGLPVMGVDELSKYAFLPIVNGKIPVEAEITLGTGIPVFEFGEAMSVPASSLTTIAAYTVPIGKNLTLSKIMFSGENIGRYSCLIDTMLINKRWTWFGGGLSGSFDFSGGGVTALSGEVVTCKVIHDRPDMADFSATIVGVLNDA